MSEEQPPGATMQWSATYDDWDNMVWELASPMHDDGSAFMYRLKPMLEDNKIVWVETSDTEISEPGQTWDSLEEAVKEIEQAWRNCLAECEE